MKPKYIDPNCPCGEALVLSDLLDDPNMKLEDAWEDEFACPKCYDGDGIYIDFEPEDEEELGKRIADVDNGTAEFRSFDEFLREMDRENGLTEEEIEQKEKEREEEIKKRIEEGDFPKTKRILNFD